MSENNEKTTREKVGCCSATQPEAAKGGGCGDMMQDCCGALKRHRLAVFTVVSAIVLAVLVSQVGGVLGIIGFFRTL